MTKAISKPLAYRPSAKSIANDEYTAPQALVFGTAPTRAGLGPARDRVAMRFISTWKGAHGWRVKVFLDGKELKATCFAARKFGGSNEAALEAAKCHRDTLLVAHKVTPVISDTGVRSLRDMPKRGVPSGVVGVALIVRTLKNGKVSYGWLANSVTVTDGHRTQYYSAARFGYEKGWELAVQARARFIGKALEVPPVRALAEVLRLQGRSLKTTTD